MTENILPPLDLPALRRQMVTASRPVPLVIRTGCAKGRSRPLEWCKLPCLSSNGLAGERVEVRRLTGVIFAVPTVGRDLPVTVSGNGLQFLRWQFGLPRAIIAEQGVEQVGNPAHDGDSVRLVVRG